MILVKNIKDQLWIDPGFIASCCIVGVGATFSLEERSTKSLLVAIKNLREYKVDESNTVIYGHIQMLLHHASIFTMKSLFYAGLVFCSFSLMRDQSIICYGSGSMRYLYDSLSLMTTILYETPITLYKLTTILYKLPIILYKAYRPIFNLAIFNKK